MAKHLWKEFAKLVNAPYNKRFKTDGWGEFRIDSKGLYSYENKEYEWDRIGGLTYLESFLNGEIVLLKGEIRE